MKFVDVLLRGIIILGDLDRLTDGKHNLLSSRDRTERDKEAVHPRCHRQPQYGGYLGEQTASLDESPVLLITSETVCRYKVTAVLESVFDKSLAFVQQNLLT